MAFVVRVHRADSTYQGLEALTRNRQKRHQAGTFLVEAVRGINAARRAGWSVEALVYSASLVPSPWAQEILHGLDVRVHYVVEDTLFRALGAKDHPVEVMALVRMAPDDLGRITMGSAPLILVFDRPVSPGNLGTLIRSSDALGAHGLIITGHAADLYDPETVRASVGSLFSVPVVRLPSAGELGAWLLGLRRDYPSLVVAGTGSTAAIPLSAAELRGPVVVMVGNETHGLSATHRRLCDVMLRIPMVGQTADSLNVASAGAIILYEAARQRGTGLG